MKGGEAVLKLQCRGSFEREERGSALLAVVIAVAILSFVAVTAVRVVTADQRSLRYDLAREQALATAEAGIEYAIQKTITESPSHCRNGCAGEFSGQGEFFVQVARADEAPTFDWLLGLHLINRLLSLRLLPIPDYEWVAVSEGEVDGVQRYVLAHFSSDGHILRWMEIIP